MQTSAPVKKERQFSRTEQSVMVLSLLLFLFMSYVYVRDLSLKSIFFPSSDSFLSKPIGKISVVNGSGLRQRSAAFEFQDVDDGTVLYPNDTLMTRAGSTMTIVLSDGKTFELPENSLIKLVFDYDFSMGSLVPKMVIEVLATPKPVPTATPAPTRAPVVQEVKVPLAVTRFSPANSTKLAFTKAEYEAGKKTVEIRFSANKKPEEIVLKLNGKAFPITIANDGAYKANVDLHSPGSYTWEVTDREGLKAIGAAFSVEKSIPMIRLLPTEGTDNRLQGLSTERSFSGFKLNWEPVKGSAEYSVTIYKPDSDAIALRKTVKSPTLLLNKNNLLLGQMAYRVEKTLERGFIAVSAKERFGFKFLPPQLTDPVDKYVYDQAAWENTKGLLIFTWSKLNYTEQYQIEISKSPAFAALEKSKRTRDNFFTWRRPPSGNYYWRVFSVNSGELSPPSPTRSVTIP